MSNEDYEVPPPPPECAVCGWSSEGIMGLWQCWECDNWYCHACKGSCECIYEEGEW